MAAPNSFLAGSPGAPEATFFPLAPPGLPVPPARRAPTAGVWASGPVAGPGSAPSSSLAGPLLAAGSCAPSSGSASNSVSPSGDTAVAAAAPLPVRDVRPTATVAMEPV
ncbi:hypothetical protein Vafri_3076 [Volvox africanus]|uniref:Uncharacterized protein n=1 Tax=Volvox africanus TaxID=51714 RepID=A0A8J4EVZ8_9CHLO|nr:hypothetical protein Vafri_3076 [Volvox africanus]